VWEGCSEPVFAMELTGIHHVTLLVEDQGKAAWFYGDVLGLEEKGRPSFKFPGLFYFCGNQEIHLIVSAENLHKDDLFIDIGVDETGEGESEVVTRRHIHRHAAFLVSDLKELRARLEAHDVEILHAEDLTDLNDELAVNMMNGWHKMYGAVPIFVFDPFQNLIEFVPTL